MDQNPPELLTPRQVAQAIGVSEASLKRWCDKGLIPFFRTVGGHRRLPIDGVIQFIRSTGRSLRRPEVIGLPPATGQGQTLLHRAAEQVQTAMLAGDQEQTRRIVFDLYLGGHDTCTICDRILAEAFRQIGNAWEHKMAEVYQERHACEICLRVLHEWERMLPSPPEGAPIAIGGTLEPDPYQLPTTMAAVVLREAGWQADSYGNGNPAQTLAAAINSVRPRLFWLSVSSISSPAQIVADAGLLHEAATGIKAGFIVGGRAIDPAIRKKISFAEYGKDMRDLVNFATPLYAITPPAPKTRPPRIVY